MRIEEAVRVLLDRPRMVDGEGSTTRGSLRGLNRRSALEETARGPLPDDQEGPKFSPPDAKVAYSEAQTARDSKMVSRQTVIHQGKRKPAGLTGDEGVLKGHEKGDKCPFPWRAFLLLYSAWVSNCLAPGFLFPGWDRPRGPVFYPLRLVSVPKTRDPAGLRDASSSQRHRRGELADPGVMVRCPKLLLSVTCVLHTRCRLGYHLREGRWKAMLTISLPVADLG